MELCKKGEILNCCHPNALMTLSEYLEDYASASTKEIGIKLIDEQLKLIPKDSVRGLATNHINAIRGNDSRDFYF